MAGYKSLQMADALQRVSQQLTPQVTTKTLGESVYGRNTNTADATKQVRADLEQGQRYYESIYSKTGSDYAQDAGVALAKGIVSVPQAAAGLVDIIDAGMQAPFTDNVQGGRFTKALEDVGVGFKETQDVMSGWYSDGTQKQFQGLSQLPGMSTQKSLGDNLDSLGQTAGYVLDNPSLALNTIVESLPSIAAGGLIGKGVAKLGGKAVAGAVGEGTVMAGQAQANMDRNAEGYTTGSQALGALGIGVLGGAVGQLGNRFASSRGAGDIDNLSAGVANQAPNQGFKSLGIGTLTETAEEAAQSSIENVISNISSGKDAIEGLNQDLVLGALAGAGMGGAVNLRSAVASEALSALTNAASKQSEKIKERLSRTAPEQTDVATESFADISSENYNPTAHIIREARKVTPDASPDEIATARTNMDTAMETAESRLNELTEMKALVDSEEKWANNLAGAQSAVEQFAETDPERAQKAQNAIDSIITPQLERIQQVKDSITAEQLDGAIEHTSTLVKDARVMYDKFTPMFDQAQSGTTDQQIFGAPTSYSVDQIQQALNDATISDTSKVALRALSDAVVAQNAVKDLDAVRNQVIGKSLDPNYISTPQYLEQFGSAIQRGSTSAQKNLLNQIKAFENSHVPKAKLADSAFQFANRLGRSVQIVKADGEWKVNAGKPLKGDEVKKNGALTIHPAKNGKKGSEDLVNYMNTEATAITATRTAMEAMQQSQTPIQTETQQQEAPMDFSAAMDSYNQDMRDNYDFQPERKVTDPRNNETRSSTTEPAPRETNAQTEIQPTSGTSAGTVDTKLPESNSQDYDLVFDENGVGRNVPKARNKVTLTTKNKYGEKLALESTKVETDDAVEDANVREEERAKPIEKRDLIKDGFNRRDTPLAKTPDLHKGLKSADRAEQAIKYLTDIEPTKEHVNNVLNFSRFREDVANAINGAVKVRRVDNPDYVKYQWQDYLQFLVKDDGTFDDDVITAVAGAAYLYVAENAEVKTKTEKDVAKLLRLKNVDSIPHHIFSKLAEVGDHRNLLRATLGQRASAALGYKQVSDVSEVRTGKLNDALGSLVLRSLTDMGIVEITTMPNSDFEAMRQEIEDDQGARKEKSAGLNDGQTNNFARIVPGDLVTNITKANEKTNSVLSKMLAVKSELTMPVLEVPTDLIKNSFNDKGTPYPTEAVETTKISQARPYGFMNQMLKVTDALRELDLIEYKRILGFKTENELADMQVMKQLGQKSVNDSIDRSLKIVDEFRADLATKPKGAHTPFYLPQFLVSNTRSHYASDLNPQADKIHRGLVGMKEHEVELDTNQQYFTDKGITELGRFMQAIAMNIEDAPLYKNPLNNKYATIDKANYKKFIPSMLQYLEQPHVVLAIQAMQNVQKGKGTHSDLTAISSFVREGGMKMQSLKALQALADFDAAKQYGSKFITDITFESDGVTNGPFLTGISTNTLADAARNAGGLFRDDKLTSVPEYKEGLGQDLYEFLGEAMKSAWAVVKAGVIEKNKKMAMQAIESLDTLYPVFGSRSGAKPITTTATYGAGDNSIKAANAREVINNLINKLDTNDLSEALPFINAANNIIKYIDVIAKFKAKENGKPHVAIPLIPTNVNPKQITLAPTQIQTLFDYSKKMHGSAIEEALKQGLGDFIPVRNTLTNHASLAFEFFDVLRVDALEAATQRAIQEKTLETVNGKPIETISVKEKNRALREIAKYTPTFTNAMAAVSGNRAQSSTPLMKTEKELMPGNLGKSELHFKDGSQVAHAQMAVPANPGVSGLALAIQSMDSFVTHFVMRRMASQNYHDANASSIKDATKMAQIQNEGVFTALRIMHLSSGMVKAFLTTANGAFDLGSLTSGEILTDGIEEALRKMVNASKEQYLGEFDLAAEIQQQVMSAFDRDIAKLRELAEEKYVGQYGTQEGHYTVTDADRKAIGKEVNKLKADRVRQLEEAARLGKALNDVTGYKKPAKTAVSIESIMQGGIEYRHLKDLLQKELSQYTGESNTAAQQYSVLFKELMKMFNTAIPNDLVLKGIKVNSTDADNIPKIEQVRENSISAWFGKDANGKDAIFFAQEAGMPTAKVVVHELLHAATVNAIAQFRANPDKYPEGKAALDRVEKLFNNVKKKVANDKKVSGIVKYGVRSVEEFIATGLTYPEFVDFLAKTQVQSGSRSALKFTDGFAEFIKSVADVIGTFVKSKVFQSGRMISALEALVYDTTDIIQNSVNMHNDLVSAPVQLGIFGAPQQARNVVSGYSAKQVFDALDSNIDPQFKAHLSQMMTQVADTIYAGLDDALIANPDGSWSVERAWEEMIKSGKANTTETATTAGFRMTEQESFAVESLYASLVHGLKDQSMSQVGAEMRKAFDASARKLKPENFYDGDWSTATRDDKQDAQDMHDFVFKYSRDNPEPLARFVAMALGSQQFNKMLGFTIKDTAQAPTGVFEKLIEGTNDVMNFVGGLLTNSSYAQTVNNKLDSLAKELARIDAKNRDFAIGKVEAQFDKIADVADEVGQKIRDQVVALADKDAIANSRFTAVRLASNTTRLAAKGDLWTTLDVIKDGITLNNPNERLGILGEIANEAANNDATKSGVEKLMRLTKLNDQMKENIRDTTTKNVLSTFEENGAYLNQEDKASLTTMMRSDVQSLVGTYSVAEIAQLYSDSKFLNSEIKAVELALGDQVMANRAKDLAWYMVSGKGSRGLAKNARLIVSGFNTGEVVDESDARINLVDTLASLYAVSYTNPGDKARITTIAKRELKNKTNGIDTLIKFHKDLAQTAKDTLFVDNPTSAIKGFVPEITNPNREVRIALNDVDAKLFKDQFYKEVKSLTKDTLDKTTTTPRLFLTEEANIQRVVSGSIELVSTNRKGTVVNLGSTFSNTVKAVNASFNQLPSYDPRKSKEPSMIPSYNTQNEITGFNYEMSGKNRDVLLERNNDFAQLLGAYASTNFNKVTVPQQNNRVVDAAYEDYKENFSKNPRAYVTVGPNTTDIGLREVWAMLPESTRKHITETWGKDGMQVRNDVLLTMFGYRKYSLNQSFDKLDETKSTFEKLYTGIMYELFGNNAKIRGVQGERAWQEGVRLMKDIIVIRNVKTMLANTMSNAMLLMAHGVSTTDIVKDTLLSVRSGLQYRRDVATLLSAQQKQRAGVGDFNQLEQVILKAQDSLARNPLASFIEEGMMPTIVEDVEVETDHYSYKSKLQTKFDEATSIVPKSVKTAAKWAFVSPDTPLYKLLNNATQFSDFSSKYVMYKYYTTKAKDKMGHDEAIQTASDNFVNYDIPTAKGLQYLNDMGVVMFTKYNIRIQKALFQLMKKRPATAMAQALFINSFTNMESGIDPLIWFNMGNPLRGGAIGLPSALDEPLPIKMITSVF